jgi:hypothetical protein
VGLEEFGNGPGDLLEKLPVFPWPTDRGPVLQENRRGESLLGFGGVSGLVGHGAEGAFPGFEEVGPELIAGRPAPERFLSGAVAIRAFPAQAKNERAMITARIFVILMDHKRAGVMDNIYQISRE